MQCTIKYKPNWPLEPLPTTVQMFSKTAVWQTTSCWWPGVMAMHFV